MGIKIMLVDDSSIVRGILKKTLRLTKLRIDSIAEAGDGQQALEKLQESPVDLIFLDINMPVMNGVEFMRTIRQSDSLRDTAVIVVSTEGSEERIKQMKELQVKSFIRKPFTPEQIAEVLKRVTGVPND